MKKAVLIYLLFCFQILISESSRASIKVMFHPHDPTLETIAQWFSEAQSRIDIAMYNMEISEKSAIIKALKSAPMQEKIKNHELQIRLIFEGYGTDQENQAKMTELEALGIDVRFMGITVKVHHKLAIIDPLGINSKVITGSANWSLSSYQNYSENILFIEKEDEITSKYLNEFETLWRNSKPFGVDLNFSVQNLSIVDRAEYEVYFNSGKKIEKINAPNYSQGISSQLEKVIQSAKSNLKIATTRIRLENILQAVSEAAERGIKIQIILSQDDYADFYKRSHWLMNKPNIEVKFKFYNLKVSQYLMYQMHNKFVIVDDRYIFTGSFNWSDSSEDGHIENVIYFDGNVFSAALNSYLNEYNYLWNMGNEKYDSLLILLNEKKNTEQSYSCGFSPMILTVEQIKFLLKFSRGCGENKKGG